VADGDKILRLYSHGDIAVVDLVRLLDDLEYTYNGVVAFESMARRLSSDPDALFPYYGRRRREFGPLVLDRQEVASLVYPRQRLRFEAASLTSPGFFDFLGRSLSVEAVSSALSERQRRKDFEAQTAHRRRMEELSETDRETEVVLNRYKALKEMGIDEDRLAPLRNELIERPFRAIAQHVDSGLIEGVEVYDPDDRPGLPPATSEPDAS
jgi:hypothetical protein